MYRYGTDRPSLSNPTASPLNRAPIFTPSRPHSPWLTPSRAQPRLQARPASARCSPHVPPTHPCQMHLFRARSSRACLHNTPSVLPRSVQRLCHAPMTVTTHARVVRPALPGRTHGNRDTPGRPPSAGWRIQRSAHEACRASRLFTVPDILSKRSPGGVG